MKNDPTIYWNNNYEHVSIKSRSYPFFHLSKVEAAINDQSEMPGMAVCAVPETRLHNPIS